MDQLRGSYFLTLLCTYFRGPVVAKMMEEVDEDDGNEEEGVCTVHTGSHARS